MLVQTIIFFYVKQWHYHFNLAPMIEINPTFTFFSSKKFKMVRTYVGEKPKDANSNFVFLYYKNVRVFVVRNIDKERRIRNEQRELQ